MLMEAPQFLLWSVYERIRTYYGLYVDFVPLNCVYWLACQEGPQIKEHLNVCNPMMRVLQFHPQIKGAEKSFFYATWVILMWCFLACWTSGGRVWTSGSKDNWNRIKWWEIWDFENSQLKPDCHSFCACLCKKIAKWLSGHYCVVVKVFRVFLKHCYDVANGKWLS